MDQVESEIWIVDPDAHWVPIKRYGSEGLKPKNPNVCKHNGEVSCISGSGSSICGGFQGIDETHVLCIERYPGQLKSGGLMVELYKDGDSMAIVTDAPDEETFLHQFCEVLSALVDGGLYESDWDFQFRHWLPQVVDICCKYRGYKNNVLESRILCAGNGLVYPAAPKVASTKFGKVEIFHIPLNEKGASA